jgi:hypothetical protein
MCSKNGLDPLMERYGELLTITEDETVAILENVAEVSAVIFDSIRYGLSELDSCIKKDEEEGDAKTSLKPATSKPEKNIPNSEVMNTYARKLSGMMSKPFKLDLFFHLLVEGIEQCVDCDRVVLTMLKMQDGAKYLRGLSARGDMEPEAVSAFQHQSINPDHAAVQALKACKDMVVPAGTAGAFPDNLVPFLEGRTIYLFPLCLHGKGVAMLYLDKEKTKGSLNKEQIKCARLFRDLGVKGLLSKQSAPQG